MVPGLNPAFLAISLTVTLRKSFSANSFRAVKRINSRRAARSCFLSLFKVALGITIDILDLMRQSRKLPTTLWGRGRTTDNGQRKTAYSANA